MNAEVGDVGLFPHPGPDPFEIDHRMAQDVARKQELAAFGHVVGTQAGPIPSWRLSHTFAIAAMNSDFGSI